MKPHRPPTHPPTLILTATALVCLSGYAWGRCSSHLIFLTPFGFAYAPIWPLFAYIVPTVAIEFLVVAAMVRTTRKGRLFLGVMAIHLITYPLTVWLAFSISVFAEVVPLILEGLFYVWFFKRFAPKDWVVVPPSQQRCFFISLIANVVTFVLGIFATIALHLTVFEPHPSVARLRSDMRTMETGLESYYIDHKGYPDHPRELTTPIAYIIRVYEDRSARTSWRDHPLPYRYYAVNSDEERRAGWIVWASGPDHDDDLTMETIGSIYNPSDEVPSAALIEQTYDPSNGSKSSGDVWRVHEQGKLSPFLSYDGRPTADARDRATSPTGLNDVVGADQETSKNAPTQ